jgi:hypothetical protein
MILGYYFITVPNTRIRYKEQNMFYTEHARMRITERNYSIDMIEDAMNLFSLHGKWDQKMNW